LEYVDHINKAKEELEKLKLPNGRQVEGTRHLALGIDGSFIKVVEQDLHHWAGRASDSKLKGIVKILLSKGGAISKSKTF